ncbi:receptor-type tyrosine-protein phosphatase mu isoform X1 [Magallana gigas]|uniref:receptor-type tyrosine-protein phosphatase mu isoform X1 n=1 Tax=Magallana gigas TaxID=29159 RepID=UPI003341B179
MLFLYLHTKHHFIFITGFCFLLTVSRSYDNIAHNKQAYQQNQFLAGNDKYDASNAVDGLKSDLTSNGGQCAISAAKQTATLWVNLTAIHSIHHITIYFMTNDLKWGSSNILTPLFLGFSVYVSNTTDRLEGMLCFKDTNLTLDTIPAVFTTACPVHGQYVIYYNERLSWLTYPKEYSPYAESNLCEVEVYGCAVGEHFGVNCSIPCPDVNCQFCQIETGTCQGCKSGYQGHRCELACPYGFFGQGCGDECNEKCNGCNTLNGLCDYGCKSGWTGNNCNNECEARKYGINCSKNCGNCHNQSKCHNVDGSCSGGCSAGYTGSLCTEHCEFGKYGEKCSKTCSNCRNQSNCQNVDGFCSEGCSDGYKGFLCTEPCEQTFYGVNCSQKCSTNCSSQACHPMTGQCIDSLKIGAGFDNLYYLFAVPIFAIIVVLILKIMRIFCIKKKRYKNKKDKRNRKKTRKNEETKSGLLGGTVTTTMTYAERSYENIELEDHKSISISAKPPRKQGIKYEQLIEDEDGDFDIDEKTHKENPYGDIYLNTESIKDISISNLWNVIMENSKNENDGFKKEYATLLYGERHPCEIGKYPENVTKNRFKTTFPYDHSRIVLENQTSDYINANFIDGLRQKDEYIATQGPLPSTVDDFWLMIWQENVVQIVMLTNLKEGTKKKCAKYWPDLNADKDCDVFIINTFEEKQYANCVIRKILMTNEKENEKRTITQYHYITWPDHGVPDPLCLLLFHNHVTRTKTSTHKGPTLVHCSAGIGRTGTYIAIDALHKEVQQENKINIAEYVKKMREKRMNMVQTYEQYRTVFLTLYEMYKAPATVQNTSEFIEKLETAKIDTTANVSFFRDEFQRLISVRHQRRDDNDKMASEGDGLSTNACIRPRYENVTLRTSSVSNRGSNIDGIFIHSFTDQNAFIVTHCPPADDVVDFLGLITEYDSEVVVFMEPLNSIESTDTWVPTPSRSSKSVPPFTIQQQQENTKENNWHKVEITKENTDFKPRMVHLAAPTHDLTPNNAQTVPQILGLVSFAQNTMGEGPIIVVSKDGSALCGVFCAVYSLKQQLTMDEEIDVFSVVRLLQTRRPELCSTMEEYEMINHAMMTFIQSRTDEITYYNQ